MMIIITSIIIDIIMIIVNMNTIIITSNSGIIIIIISIFIGTMIIKGSRVLRFILQVLAVSSGMESKDNARRKMESKDNDGEKEGRPWWIFLSVNFRLSILRFHSSLSISFSGFSCTPFSSSVPQPWVSRVFYILLLSRWCFVFVCFVLCSESPVAEFVCFTVCFMATLAGLFFLNSTANFLCAPFSITVLFLITAAGIIICSA